MRGSIERARGDLAERLRERRSEIGAALLNRTCAIADPSEIANPEYAQGLRAAVSAALDYGIEGVERGEDRAPPVPVLLLAQARLAARNDVPLDTVLRRYFAGYTLLGDFIVQEAGAATLKEPWLKRLLREQAAMFDRFLVAVTEEYGREGETGPASTAQRLVERVERLLDGELLDASELKYEFEAHHLGILAGGSGATATIQGLATTLDRRLLAVNPGGEVVWAWLGGRQGLDPAEVESLLLRSPPGQAIVAIGEPGHGISGWRLSHRQARVAWSIARRRPRAVTRYAGVALLASAISDDLLAQSLNELYLAPLAQARDGGEVLLQTLRAYFSAERNAVSAAAALGVSRQAVNSRLRAIEKLLGRQLSSCAAEVEIALRIDEFDGHAQPVFPALRR